MTVDRLPAEVLQGGHPRRQGPQELQGDLLGGRVDEVGGAGPVPAGRPSLGGHVMVHQLEHAVETGHRLRALGVRLQEEGAGVALDAEVLGARRRLDAEGEEVAVVGAVADEEGAGRLGAQQAVGLFAADGSPVEAALLELAHGAQDQLVLHLGAEGLEAVGREPHAGFEGAAAHRGVKLAVGYHGAAPAPQTTRPRPRRVRKRAGQGSGENVPGERRGMLWISVSTGTSRILANLEWRQLQRREYISISFCFIS